MVGSLVRQNGPHNLKGGSSRKTKVETEGR